MTEELLKVEAPGKVILHGEHSVVYGKRAIAVSVALSTRLSISLAPEVRVKFPEVGIDSILKASDLAELKTKLGQDFNFHTLNGFGEIPISENIKDVLDAFCDSRTDLQACEETLRPAQKAAFQAFLFLYLGILDDLTPYCFSIETDLPVGGGLGSSASFAVALAGGILLVSGREPLVGFNVDSINRWAFVSEKFVHGSPSGVDNSVAAFGGGVIFRKGEALQHIPDCPDIRALLVYTKVPRSTKVLVAKVAALKEAQPELFERTMNEMDEVVGQCVAELQTKKAVSPALIIRNQQLLELLGVSHPTLDLIVQLAVKNGLSAKLTGAGGGGCAFIAIPSNFDSAALQPLLNSLKENGFDYWDTVLGCRGFQVSPSADDDSD